MERRKIGSLEVSAIGYGCMGLTHSYPPFPSEEDGINIIHKAIDMGVDFFDTAEIYGPLTNEILVGKALKGVRDKVVLATKFGFDLNSDKRDSLGNSIGLNSKPEHIRKALEGSLKRLQTDHIDLYYQHRFDPDVPIEEVAETISKFIKEGKVLYWGLSECGIDILRRAHSVCSVTAIQNEYSMWFREPEKALISVCEELNIGLVAFSPLGKGVLTGSFAKDHKFAENDFRKSIPRFSNENMKTNYALVELVYKLAEEKQTTPARISLAWLLAQKPWIVPIPGTKKISRLEENLGAVDIKFTQEELGEIRKAMDDIHMIGDRYAASQESLTRK